jgi:hypothetical protein
MVVGAAATESRQLKRVTEEEHQLIDPNTAPQTVMDGEGELVLKILWSYVDSMWLLSGVREYVRPVRQYILFRTL